MISLFVILIVVIGLTSMVGMTVFQFQQTSEVISLAQRNASQMETVAALVRGSSRVVDGSGALRSPMGEPRADGRLAVPSWVTGSAVSPWGVHYGYCPYAATTGGSLDVVSGANAAGAAVTYKVAKSTAADRDYVVASDAPPVAGESVIALIVSPSPHQSSLPNCHDVEFRDGFWVVGGPDGSPRGSVVAVTASGNLSALSSSSLDPVIYVSPATIGSGSGTSPGSAMAFDAALETWRQTQPRSISFLLVPDAGSTEFKFKLHEQELIAANSGQFVRIASASGAPLQLRTPGGATPTATIRLGVNAQIDNLLFSPRVGLTVMSGANVKITGSSLRFARIDGGDLTIGAGTTLLHSGEARNLIEMTAGRLNLVGPSIAIDLSPSPLPYTGIRATAGTVSIETNLTATGPTHGTIWPWQLTGTARLQVGLSGAASLNGAPIRAEVTQVGETCSNASSCTVSCPTLTYPVSGSCLTWTSAPDTPDYFNALAGSHATPDGWKCAWRPDTGGLSPLNSRASVQCSATLPSTTN